jgi:CarD family transcriptional regulator
MKMHGWAAGGPCFFVYFLGGDEVMFAVGDLIIYGGEGVCRVDSIGVPDMANIDQTKEYYVLSPLYRSGKIFAPVSTPVHMRSVIGREEAEALIGRIAGTEPDNLEHQNARALKEYYQTTVATYGCDDLVKLIKTARAKRDKALHNGRKVSQIDERYLKRAEEQLYGELAVALEIDREQVPEYIAGKLAE